MNLYDVIKKPVVTEKSMHALEEGKYTFEVDTRAHKRKTKAKARWPLYRFYKQNEKSYHHSYS